MRVATAASWRVFSSSLNLELLLALLASKGPAEDSPLALVLKATDFTAAGSTDTYLTTPLQYKKDAHGQEIVVVNAGDEEVGVMMGWERPISEFYPLCTCSPLKRGSLKWRRRSRSFAMTMRT